MAVDFFLGNPSQWLEELLSLTQLTEPAKAELRDQYTYGRTYHGMFHIAFLWHCHVTLGRFSKLDNLPVHQMMANAIACHDVDMTIPDSEVKSELWWRTHHKPVYFSPVYFSNNINVEWVSKAILASADHFADRSMNTDEDILLQWFLGIDLIPLAAPAPLFDKNTYMLRAEYSHLTDDAWEIGRRGFLAKVEAADVIYRHPVLHSLFEDAARANVQRALTK